MLVRFNPWMVYFRDNPKLGDGNCAVYEALGLMNSYFRDNPKLGDGTLSTANLSLFILYFRDNPKLGDGILK